jgi:hypothetical protein
MTDDAPDGAKFAYMHGDHVAFYLTERPVEGMVAVPDTVIMPNGSQPAHGDPIVCGTCPGPLDGLSTERVREL